MQGDRGSYQVFASSEFKADQEQEALEVLLYRPIIYMIQMKKDEELFQTLMD